MNTAGSSPGHGSGLFAWLGEQPQWLVAFFAALIALIAWQCWMAPPWKIGDPPGRAGIDFLAADGTMLAHRGERPVAVVDAASLPAHVRQAFLAIEDRRFYDHGGLDFRGLARATIDNARAGGVVAGGSTITQQYVKNAFLTQDRTVTRKAKEMLLADWVELWTGKDAILSRYLENCYFGEGQTGLVAAANHYFSKTPADLSVAEAAMLAGMVKAPSRLAPTVDYDASVERMRVVLAAMVDAGFLSGQQAEAEGDPTLDIGEEDAEVDQAGWFVDWLMADLPEGFEGEVRTTLVPELQARAERAIARAGLGTDTDGTQVALIAMRPDGSVAAMVGGKAYTARAFNRATMAERQPGSTFKLFDYFAAMREGATPDDTVTDAPVRIGNWQPGNGYRGYRGRLTLRHAFAMSSNTAAIRVADRAGLDAVRAAAGDLGITAELPRDASLALGTGSVTLKEMAAAYAAFAGGRYPVKAHGVAGEGSGFPGALARELDPATEWAPMLDLLWNAANRGTGKGAALATPTFGKTGTSQDGRDALFIGFSGDLVTAVWIGRDDNKPIPGNSGGGLPARIWKQFMRGADIEQLPLPVDVEALRRQGVTRRPAGDSDDEAMPMIEVEGFDVPVPDLGEGGNYSLDLPAPPEGALADPVDPAAPAPRVPEPPGPTTPPAAGPTSGAAPNAGQNANAPAANP